MLLAIVLPIAFIACISLPSSYGSKVPIVVRLVGHDGNPNAASSSSSTPQLVEKVVLGVVIDHETTLQHVMDQLAEVAGFTNPDMFFAHLRVEKGKPGSKWGQVERVELASLESEICPAGNEELSKLLHPLLPEPNSTRFPDLVIENVTFHGPPRELIPHPRANVPPTQPPTASNRGRSQTKSRKLIKGGRRGSSSMGRGGTQSAEATSSELPSEPPLLHVRFLRYGIPADGWGSEATQDPKDDVWLACPSTVARLYEALEGAKFPLNTTYAGTEEGGGRTLPLETRLDKLVRRPIRYSNPVEADSPLWVNPSTVEIEVVGKGYEQNEAWYTDEGAGHAYNYHWLWRLVNSSVVHMGELEN